MSIIFDCETTGLAAFQKLCDEPRQIVSHRILSIGVCNVLNGQIKVFCGEDESQILKDFFSFLDQEQETELVGFNCDFDLNFIKVRSFVNNIKMSDGFIKLKIIDLRNVLNNSQYAVGSLGDYANALGITKKTENGKQMPIFYQNKQWDKIEDHCYEDISISLAVYKRCLEVGLI
jgi:DNA polymerase III epsilon subunit-like protein